MDEKPYYYDENGKLHFRLRAVPFGGPAYLDNKDLQNEYFTKQTDFGPKGPKESYLDHNNLVREHPELKSLPGIEDPIGEAEEVLTDEEGIVYDIAVHESYRYKNMLKKMLERNMLLGSTTPYQKGFKKKDSGEIVRWPVVEVTATWKAANPLAEQVWFKSILVEDIMAEEKDVVVEAVATDAATQAVEAATETATAVVETPLTDLVASTFKPVESNEKSVPDMFADMQAEISALKTEVAALKTAKELAEKSISDIKTAFPKLVEEVAKTIKVQVNSEYSKSIVERQVVSQTVADQHKQDAKVSVLPGRDRKANFGGKAAG